MRAKENFRHLNRIIYNFMLRLILRVRGVVRRIGNSLGLIIPWEEVQKHKIKEGDVVELEVERRVNLREMFGAFEFSKSSQEMKDQARAEWGDIGAARAGLECSD